MTAIGRGHQVGKAFLFGIALLVVVCGFQLMAHAAEELQVGGDSSLRNSIGYSERDYMAQNQRDDQGSVPVVGMVYHVSSYDRVFPQFFTFDMDKVTDIYVEIEPFEEHTSVLFQTSAPTGFDVWVPAWQNNELRDTVRFWTSSYYMAMEECNNLNCPKVRFQALNGSFEFTILDIRRRYQTVSDPIDEF